MITDVPTTSAPSGDVTALLGEILGRRSAVRLRVTGRSMGPLLPFGAWVVIRPVDSGQLRRGDILLFRNALGAPVLHRIVRIDVDQVRGRVLRTKGDALIAFDEPVLPEQVLGRVVRIERPKGYEPLRRLNLDTPFWRGAGVLMAWLQLVGAKALMKLRASNKIDR